MIWNNILPNLYGSGSFVIGQDPLPYRPIPQQSDYTNGYITRYFAKKINEGISIEINPNQISLIDSNLYQTVSLIWKISGPKVSLITNGVTQKSGIIKENFDSIKQTNINTGVDLSKVLTNPLDFWRGY